MTILQFFKKNIIHLYRWLFGIKDEVVEFIPNYDYIRIGKENLAYRINNYRIWEKLDVLEFDNRIFDTASDRCDYCIDLGEVSHDNFSDVVDALQPLGLKHFGEILASGFNTEKGALNGFKNSKEHNAIMLNPNWKYIGVGIKDKVYCVIFAK